MLDISINSSNMCVCVRVYVCPHVCECIGLYTGICLSHPALQEWGLLWFSAACQASWPMS